MYADDTVLYISHPDYDTATKGLQEDLDALSRRCVQNGIQANTDKTKVMKFGSQNVLNRLPPLDIKIGGTDIGEVTSYKYLGITLDAHLNYSLHITLVISSITAKLKLFRRMRSFLSTKAALLVYKGTLLPILEYGDIFMYAASVENRKRLQILQNKGLQCALGSGIETSTADLHIQANLLKLKYRREKHLLNFVYDIAQDVRNHKEKSTTNVQTRSANKTILRNKRPNTEKYKKSMRYVGVSKWNSLPETFHHVSSRAVYKSMVDSWISRKSKECADSMAKSKSKPKLKA